MDSLKNKKAIITGGSRGLGKAIAKAFLDEGAEVFLLARNGSELESARGELGFPERTQISALDVSNNGEVEKTIHDIGAKWTAPDILVNAAGVYGPIGLVTDVDPEEWRKAVEVNLFGTFYMVRSLGKLMKKNGGVIINFVGGGEGAYPHFSSYVSAKGAIARFTETVAAELKEFGIRVNAIAPGAVNTKFLEDILAAGPEKAGKEVYEKSLKQKEAGGTPPEKAAALCVFLASDKSRGLTGRILSAVWDPYEKFPEKMDELMNSDVFTYRRVRPEDRGLNFND